MLEILTPIWHVKAHTARSVRQRISAVMDWAVAMDYRADNPCDRVGPVLGQWHSFNGPNSIRFKGSRGIPAQRAGFFALQAVVAVAVALLDLHLLAGFRERRGKERVGRCRWRHAAMPAR